MSSTYLTRNDAELWLDDLCLTGETTTPGGDRFLLKAMADSATWGNPVPVTTSVQRWMTDGAVSSFTGWGNRNPSFKVFMYGRTSDDLAAAERELVKAARHARALKWIPPEGTPDAATAVFDVQTCQTDHQLAMDDEQRLARCWQVTIEAWPWVRSDTLTVVDALTTSVGTPDLVEVDSCASTSGWTGSPGTATATGGSIHETVVPPFQLTPTAYTASLTRAGSVSGMLTTPYLMTDVTLAGSGFHGYTVTVDGVPLVAAAVLGSITYWHMPAGVDAFTSLVIAAKFTAPAGSVAGRVLTVNDVSRTDTAQPGTSTRKQLARSLAVGGSVPTAGSIKVASPSATPLGNVLLYTRTADGSGYTPPMRQNRVAGGTVTTDATAVSGSRETFVTGGTPGASIFYTVPGGLLPEASYVIVGRFLGSAVGTLTCSVLAGLNGVSGFGLASVTGSFKIAQANAWQLGIIGQIDLPQSRLPAESTLGTNIFFGVLAGVGNVFLDELWLFDVTNGRLSIAGAPTSTRMWFDAPDADPVRNLPAIYIGNQDDRSDAAMTFLISSLGQHLLDPDGATLFTVTDNVANAAVSASFYRRGHTHPGNTG